MHAPICSKRVLYAMLPWITADIRLLMRIEIIIIKELRKLVSNPSGWRTEVCETKQQAS